MKVNCHICEEEFSKTPHKISKNTTGLFFCSKKCFGVFMLNKGGRWDENHNKKYIEKPIDFSEKIKKTKAENQVHCIYCNNSFDKGNYTRFHGENCKQNMKSFINICPDEYNYEDFLNVSRIIYVKYHLKKNKNKMTVTSAKIGLTRTYLHTLLNFGRELKDGEIIELLDNKLDSKVYLNKQKEFYKQERIKQAQEKLIELTENELYESMIPQYLYYMNIRESEYDKSDLIRLPLLIQHYKDIDAEDKVEDLEEILEIIKKSIYGLNF